MADTANVTTGGLPFVCVRLSNANFTDVAEIYVILCVDQNGGWTVLDVGQSSELGTRIDSHDRQVCWFRKLPIQKHLGMCLPSAVEQIHEGRSIEVGENTSQSVQPIVWKAIASTERST